MTVERAQGGARRRRGSSAWSAERPQAAVAERCDAARGQQRDDERAAGADAGVAPVEAVARRGGRLHDGHGVGVDVDRIGRRGGRGCRRGDRAGERREWW